MNCQEAERMVNRYINDALTIKELEEFLEHIHECKECKEDLETYFIVKKSIEQLDSDEEDTVMDMRQLLTLDIEKKNALVYHEKKMRIVASLLTMGAVILLILMVVFIGLEVNYKFL